MPLPGIKVGKPVKTYLVSAEGGSPQQLLPDDPEPQRDPNWSPDGDKMIFSGEPVDKEFSHPCARFELPTKVSTLPRSRGLYSPLVAGW